MKRIIYWECRGDLEQRWAMSLVAEWREAWALEQDLAIDLDLNPFEEIEIEFVPIELLGLLHG